jgi:hypothetical protein
LATTPQLLQIGTVAQELVNAPVTMTEGYIVGACYNFRNNILPLTDRPGTRFL